MPSPSIVISEPSALFTVPPIFISLPFRVNKAFEFSVPLFIAPVLFNASDIVASPSLL